MDGRTLWLALAVVLVIEGLLPFFSPAGWRSLFEQVLKMSNGQIRFFGLCSMAAGLVWMALLLG
ncbi:MAG: DUF2065 domain-containing protein [Polaromonas sp.]|nr:DUF2065 domain-containing protein [Polaromonas sp.]